MKIEEAGGIHPVNIFVCIVILVFIQSDPEIRLFVFTQP